MSCKAIILSGEKVGEQCLRNTVADGQLCKVHSNSLRNHGPHALAKKELKATAWDKPVRSLNKDYDSGKITASQYEAAHTRIIRNYNVLFADLQFQQRQEIMDTGRNPDADALERRRQRQAERAAERLNRRIEWLNQRAPQYLPVYPINQAPDVNNDIRAFAGDNQNVHTSVAVKQTQDIIKKVLEIPVPDQYKWNPDVCSLTPAEIISACKLKQQAVLQMMVKYTSSETIYEMENGIYGKTLDAVWQFVKNSDDKECLIQTLKTELEDNIGMCAQGNLTRLANVLAGYVDGIKPVESLQDAISNLMKIPNAEKRIDMASNLLRQHGVPVAEWEAWLEPLADVEEFSIEDGEVLVH